MNISCIIPTHNRPKLIIEAVRSVVRQTVPPQEILVVNNGSDAVNFPADLSGKVKVFNIIPDAGVSQARNFGASLAKGDYLAFLDDDDLWTKEYIAKALPVIKSGAQCIASRIDKLEEDGKFTKAFKNPHLNINNLLVSNPGAGGSNVIIAKKLFFNVGGYNISLPSSEDKSLLIEVLKRKVKIAALPNNSIIARIHSGERLTDAKSISHGIYQFTKHYGYMMDTTQKMQNWLKIYRYRYEAGSKLSFGHYMLLSVILKIIKLWKKS